MLSGEKALQRVEGKVDRLRREYDLYFTGERRTEPVQLKDEIDRDLQHLTRIPMNNTALQFRVKTLAHRFRAVGAQARNLLEVREQRRRQQQQAKGRGTTSASPTPVVLDEAAVADPRVADRYLRRLYRQVVDVCGKAAAPEYSKLRDRLVAEARRQLETPGVTAVRFRVADKNGKASIQGEVVQE